MKPYTVFLFLIPLFVGCSAAQKIPVHVTEIGIDVRTETQIIDPETGAFLDWSGLMSQIAVADIVLLGEQHDHAIGHAVQFAIVQDVMDQYPHSTLALEMLERDEQHCVDDYMEGFINAKMFATSTQSTDWGSKGGWKAWYQPIIDAVKDRDGYVVAANAPRRYTKLGRVDGFDRIDELPKERRAFVDYPETLSSGQYRQRFWDLMSRHNGDEEPMEIPDVKTSVDGDDPILKWFRGQQIWDATMARSVAMTNPSIDHKTILLVGQFHVEYDGGIVQELRRLLPAARVLVISIHRDVDSDEEWQGPPPIADLVVVDHLF